MGKENIEDSLHSLVRGLPLEVQLRARLSVAIAKRIASLMRSRGLSQRQFAEELGRRPSEITKWLSGEHNFTIASLARLHAFFGEPIIDVSSSTSPQGSCHETESL